MASVLIVENDGDALARTVEAFNRAGYIATGASTFETARQFLHRSPPPDVLIADVRLGAFNGLHLAIAGQNHNPRMTTVVTHSPADSGLQSDAARHHVAFWQKPSEARSLVSRLSKMVESSLMTDQRSLPS